MIFGNLLTSSNYKSGDEKRIVGGKNGYGAKLTNIYSKKFIVETVHNKKKYTQIFEDNMYKKNDPIIENTKKKDYTKITFVPDMERFNLSELSTNMISLLEKRVMDIAGCTNDIVSVYLNDNKIGIRTFEDYIKIFYDENEYGNIITEQSNERWTIGFVYDQNEYGFRHVSYVNGICTYQGGKHVDHVFDNISAKLIKTIKDKTKNKNIVIKNNYIKDSITLFVKSTIENPDFGSQSKEILTTKKEKFGSLCDASSKFISNIMKTSIMDDIIKMAQFKSFKELNKTDGKKKNHIKDIPKLEDAEYAGTYRSSSCRLFLTEGDSAKTFAINGMEIIGKRLYGVFPLKGKMLNVRDATCKQLINNEEIINLKKILGLKQEEKYDNYNKINKLRYGGIILLMDQDLDGSHIKGLIMNLFHYFWKDLIKAGYIQILTTPIIKIFKNSDVHRKNVLYTFNTLQDYDEWAKERDTKMFKIQYYKGLGTFKPDEAIKVFDKFDDRLILLKLDKDDNIIFDKSNNQNEEHNEEHNEDHNEDNNISESSNEIKKTRGRKTTKNKITYTLDDVDPILLAFDKNMVELRKQWLQKYDRNLILNNEKIICVSDFINKDLIHFSNSDNIRSIPSIDGFKPSQRKVMYTCLSNKIKAEIKVAQLASKVSEQTHYHHGEKSLEGTIVNLAQNFVGSNNINLLVPSGNFGSRIMGGRNAAQSRYIFTFLNDLTPKIFRDDDNNILKYDMDEGDKIEPEFYVPIIPTILINGSDGIGTGFSTSIPCYNPKDILSNIRNKINGKNMYNMIPWYKGYTGRIEKIDAHTFLSYGRFEIINENTIKVSELPIDRWTQDYKEYLESITLYDKNDKNYKDKIILQYINNSGNSNIDFEITFVDNVLYDLNKENKIYMKMKLLSYIKTSNMNICDTNGIVKKFNDELDLMNYFCNFRYGWYETRKEYMLSYLLNKLNIVKYKKKFIEFIIAKKIIINNRSKSAILDDLVKHNFPKLSISNDDSDLNYRYLIDLPLFSLTLEKIEELEEEYKKKQMEYDVYLNKTINEIWLDELTEFETLYDKLMKESSKSNNSSDKKIKGKKK